MTFIMAHEFLDALPIYKFVKTENGLFTLMYLLHFNTINNNLKLLI